CATATPSRAPRGCAHGGPCPAVPPPRGPDVTPTLAFAATIAGGLHGIEHNHDPGTPYEGNAYATDGLPRVPDTIVDAIAELERSEVALKAFGSDVHEHLVNTARQEWAGFHRVVTDWERRRNFEQF